MRVTAEQYKEILQRGSRQPNGQQTEKSLHSEIIQTCKDMGFLPFHGSMAHQTFRTPGEPDFVILLPGGKLLLVECKSKTGKLSPDQQAIAAWAEKLNHKIHIVRSLEEFKQLI